MIDPAGNPVSGATVTVKIVGTETLATIFSDEGITTIPNPVTTDTNGRFAFFVADGDYDLDILKTGVISVTVPDVSIVDPKRVFERVLNDEVYIGNLNAEFNRATGVWERKDTAKIAWQMFYDRVTDRIAARRAPAAANPIIWTTVMTIRARQEFSSENAAAVTITAVATTVVTVNAGTVAVGDRILVTAKMVAAKGATAGRTWIRVQRNSGTASVEFTHNDTQAESAIEVSASIGSYQYLSTIAKVTVAGTLVFALMGESGGSDSTVAIGDGGLYALITRESSAL